MGRIMTPRRETVFCKKCKSDKPLAQFSEAQRQEKFFGFGKAVRDHRGWPGEVKSTAGQFS
jgi:hypothetical protein